jgi:hypothetical protein
VGFIIGPNFGGDAVINTPLSRPMSFDEIFCNGISGQCFVDWIGNSP